MNAATDVSRPPINYRDLVQDERIHGSIYTDPEVFAHEMAELYGRGWVFVAHESEIAKPGDFVTRRLGLQSVIVTRDRSGACHILFNRCPHRGAIVCQSDNGHRRSLTCPYHGWTFGLDGALMGVPSSSAYSPEHTQPDGLAHIPRVASYGGFIFGSLSPEGPSLEKHLGKSKLWIDQLLGLSPEGEIQLTAGWMKHKMRCNWKMVVENQVDGYHAQMVHGSLLAANETFATVRDRKDTSPTRVRDFGLGHTDIDHATDYRAAGDKLFRWTGGISEERLPNYVAAMRAAYGAEEAHSRLLEGPPHAMLFPNLSLAEMNIMVVQPIGPSATVQYTTPVLLKGADELNRRTLRRCEGALGPAGFLIADDAEIGELNQLGVQNQEPEWLLLNRGMASEEVRTDGTRVGGLMDETSQRGFWRHYRDVMSGALEL
jgi:phenylpropionate dioxygenase-like ring-hydroxylating dioxygenase large terminal subunit